MELRDKRVLVTGGSVGIGRAIAAELKRAEASVMICARSAEPLEQTASQLQVQSSVCDVSESTQVEELAQRVRDQWGGLDILVNNAGIQYHHDFTQPIAFAEVEHEIGVNLIGPIRLIQVLLPLLREAHEAAIVNVTSGLALLPKRTAPVYCATKAGLRSLSISLGWQLEQTNVHVMEVLPPRVRTAMTMGRQQGAIAPAAVARALVRGLRSNAREVLVGQSRLLAYLLRIAPWVAAGVLKKL
jgi:uncharacterized oxidoreductase